MNSTWHSRGWGKSVPCFENFNQIPGVSKGSLRI